MTNEQSQPQPRLITFFIPLPEPVGIPHGSTYSFDEGSVLPDFDPLPVFATQSTPPIPGKAANQLMVSLKFWEVKSKFVQLMEQFRAVGKVLDVVRGPSPSVDTDLDIECTLTVVEAVTQLAEDTQVGISSAFDRCLARIDDITFSYGLVSRHAIAPVTLKRLPNLIKYTIRRGLSATHSAPSIFNLGHDNEVNRLVPPELSDDSQAGLLSMISAIAIADPVIPYLELSAEARRSFDREGDTRSAVIHSQAACEVLLDSVFEALLWEEGMSPSQAVRDFFSSNSTLGGRVRRSDAYAVRLGTGHWRLNGSGPVAIWYSELAALRNRCVHAGYRPTTNEALAASRAQYALRDFIAGRLVDRQRRYPRVASIFTQRAQMTNTRGEDITDFGRWQADFIWERVASA